MELRLIAGVSPQRSSNRVPIDSLIRRRTLFLPAGASTSALGAFTLIELLTVIAIISLLAGVVFGIGRRAAEAAQVARAKADLAVIAAALESFKRQHGDYPRTDRPEELLQALVGKRGAVDAKGSGRVLIDLALLRTGGDLDPLTNESARLDDPWGHSYAYAYRTSVPWLRAGFLLYSAGQDGAAASLLAGGLVDESAPANADNIYANR